MAETESLSSGENFYDLILNHIKENVSKDLRYICAECGCLKNKDGELSGTLCPSCESSNLSLDPVLNKFTTLVKNLQFDIENSLGQNKNPNSVFLKPFAKYNAGVLSAKENRTLPGTKCKDKPYVANIERTNNLAIQTDLSFNPSDDVSFVIHQKSSVSNKSSKPVSQRSHAHGNEEENMPLDTNMLVNFSQKAESRYRFKPIRPEENSTDSDNIKKCHLLTYNHHKNFGGDSEKLDNIDIIISKSQEHFIETETEVIESSINHMLLQKKTNSSPLLFSPETKDSERICSDDDTECVGATPPRETENVCTWRKSGGKPSDLSVEQNIVEQEMLNTKDDVTNDTKDSSWNEGSEGQNEHRQKFQNTNIRDSVDTTMEAQNIKVNTNMNKKCKNRRLEANKDTNWDDENQKHETFKKNFESTNIEENCDVEQMQIDDNEIDDNQGQEKKLGVKPKNSNLTCTASEDGFHGEANNGEKDPISMLIDDDDDKSNPISHMKFQNDPGSKEVTEDELLTQNSQRFSKHNLKIVISNVEGDDLDHLEKFIATFDPIIDNDVSQSSNFLVVGVDSDNRVLRRTPKFLKAICLHMCIVNVDYLVQCCRVGDIVNLEKKFIPYDSSGLNGPIRSCISPNTSLLCNFVFFSLEKDDYLSSLLEFIIIHNGGILVPDIKLFKAYNRGSNIGTQIEMGPPGELQHTGTQQKMGLSGDPSNIETQMYTSGGGEYKKVLLYGENEEATFTEAYKLKVFTAYKCFSFNYKQLFDCVASYDVAELGV